MLLAIHDASFPSDPDEDVGRGSPATRAAERLFSYARALGFTGVQLGPQGQTSRANPSPYDGTIFSRHLGNISLRTFEGLVAPVSIARARLATPGGPAQHAHNYDVMHALVAEAHANLPRRPDLQARLARFRAANAAWLELDGLHAALCEQFGGAGFRAWPIHDAVARKQELVTRHAHEIDRYAFGQMLVHEEHARVRSLLAPLGLVLYGDLQVGYADTDAWAWEDAFLRDYRMGAPPSRTNPDGQPWGYPVLDPAQYGGRVREFVTARADKFFADYDSVRIDHPHGLVCPWVYAANTGDPGDAVREGARLFESPDLPDHPLLARHAIARADQIDPTCPRYADRWVTGLEPAQIDRYAALLDVIVESARRHGRSVDDLSCEVLSTMPRPLEAMLQRHGLGRWRVTQKANLADPADVYRTENAGRADWVMIGNHDTAPVFSLIRGWSPATREAWARHLVGRLHLAEPARLESPGFLATAMLAELFISRAENVSIFFADLFGYEERFNVPGLVDAANWTLRLPGNFEELHAERLAGGAAIDLRLAVELGLAAQEHGAERR